MNIALKTNISLYENSLYAIKSPIWNNDGADFVLSIKSTVPGDVYTKQYPQTSRVLKEQMPSVLKTECFNDKNIPFRLEVKNTELGHLFEHILIQHLSDIKRSRNEPKCFDGRTFWDWNENTYGTYQIWISVDHSETEVFNLALEKSISVFNMVLDSNSSKN